MDPSLTPRSDDDLLYGCLNGDRCCRETFVRQFSNLVFSTIQHVVKIKNTHLSRQSVEDLHQTVFLQLFDNESRKLKQYKGNNGCSLASWIRMLTGRIVIDHLRRGMDALAPRHHVVTLELVSELNEPGPSAVEQMTIAEQWNLITSGLKQLKARDQLVIRMHCLDGQSLRTVAQVIGVSEKNIHSIKHRAIQRLKSVITDQK